MKTKNWKLLDKQQKFVDALVALGFKESVLDKNTINHYKHRHFTYTWMIGDEPQTLGIHVDNNSTSKRLLETLLARAHSVGYGTATSRLKSAVGVFKEFLRL